MPKEGRICMTNSVYKALKNPTFNIFTHQAYISSNISSTSCDRGYQGFLFGGGGIMVAKCVIFFFNINW